jgi:myo-inositol catabolism protein IolC
VSLYVFAMDQRGWLQRAISGVIDPQKEDTDTAVRRVKRLCFAGVQRALQDGMDSSTVGVLVDEEFASDIALEARGLGLTVALAIERADREVFELEYGDDYLDHLRRFDPQLPKVLIRHNVESERDGLDEQLRRLRRVSDELHGWGWPLLLELLVPPTEAQLESFGGDVRAYDERLRPGLTLRAVEEIQAAGVHVDRWKVEGMYSRADAGSLAAACGSRDGATCLVLGRNAPWEEVELWLSNAASCAGYDGFAVGRSLWWEASRAALEGSLSWDDGVEVIAQNYRRAIGIYDKARSAATQFP